MVSPSRDYLAHLHMPILNLLLCEKQFIIADLLVSIGAHLYDQNRDEEALECFNKAIEIDSNHYEAWFNKGFLLLQLGNYKEAAECFNKAIEIYPNELFAWYYKEAALSYLNKKEEAVECLKEARKK